MKIYEFLYLETKLNTTVVFYDKEIITQKQVYFRSMMKYVG
jgi:hypothetical protein